MEGVEKAQRDFIDCAATVMYEDATWIQKGRREIENVSEKMHIETVQKMS